MKQTLIKLNPILGIRCFLFLLFFGFTAFNSVAQNTVTGTVKDADGIPLPSVTILQKGTSRGTVTDFDGKYSLNLKEGEQVLVFSYIGFKKLEIPVNGKAIIDATLQIEAESLEEVVVVGYGTQKKESVVGAISQIKGEDLQELTQGITNVQEALQGQLPGVTAIQGSGQPGRDDVQIFIRGKASFDDDGGQPLVLVDGVERSISNIDFNEIDRLSVLKDASATAVYGVQGANGVILITTKRGKKGKAQLSLQANTTIKAVSRLPEKLDAYNAILQTNSSILRELPYREDSWLEYRPLELADKFRNPANFEESLLFPNVDWQDVLTKDFAVDYRVNLQVRGGTDNARYFASFAYQKESDIFDGKDFDNGKGYSSEFSYDRFNFRSNIDFDITNTTKFSVNLGGFYATQVNPTDINSVTTPLYVLEPTAFIPVFPDGIFGRLFVDRGPEGSNGIFALTNTGFTTTNTFQINTDFILKQNLDFVTEGLSFQARFSLDNNLSSFQSLIDQTQDGRANAIFREFNTIDDPLTPIIEAPAGVNDFAYRPNPWVLTNTNVNDNSIRSNLLYDFSFNYNKTFSEKHNFTALALLRRQERGQPNDFSVFREDWVSRVTYDYDKRYFLDISGAYNGSEKFQPGNRFALFPAIALGWTPSNESFMEDIKWVNKLKFRGSYGLIGDDTGGARFAYQASFNNTGGGATISTDNINRPTDFPFFSEENLGNPDLGWATAIKYNIGVELGLFNNAITAEFDYFGEDRSNILIPGSERAVSDLLGINPPPANTGEVQVRGFELTVGANHTFGNGLNIFGNFNFNVAKDLTISREDPELRPFWLKDAGFPVGQERLAIPDRIIQSLDDLYGATPQVNGGDFLRTGYYNVIDYDGDGIYNPNFDNVPYGYPNRPQITWTSTIGARYKGWKLSTQLYGASNSNRFFVRSGRQDLYFLHELDFWTKDNPTGTRTEPTVVTQGNRDPRSSFFDASLVRLRAIALSYALPKETCKKLGLKAISILANGNNLFLWSDLPDDREFNSSATTNSIFRGDYPNLIRFNLGFNIDF